MIVNNSPGFFGDFFRRETASATLEFILVFPLVITIFIAVFETGMILSRQVLLERSVDEAVRLLRLGRMIQEPDGTLRALTSNDIEVAICDNTTAIADCENVLVVDLRVIDTRTYEMPETNVACVDRDNTDVDLGNDFTQGANHELILMRACAIIDPIFPFSGFGLNLARDDTGGRHMVATSVFVNEPA